MQLVFSKISSSQVSRKFALPMRAAAECKASKELVWIENAISSLKRLSIQDSFEIGGMLAVQSIIR